MISFLVTTAGYALLYALLWEVSPIASIGCACLAIGLHLAKNRPTPTTPTGDER